jgi:uncharacterized damage-inducible protein DinB
MEKSLSGMKAVICLCFLKMLTKVQFVMKTLLTQLAAYNLWANGLLTACIKKLPAHLHTQTIASSFPSLQATLLHQWDAESIWWQRMKLQEQVVRPSAGFSGDLDAVVKGLLNQSRQWQEWVQQAQDHMLGHEFIYQSSKKEKFKQPVFQVLLHLFNHGTYHRGQLVTMLRQIGVTDIPASDFIIWSRSKS